VTWRSTAALGLVLAALGAALWWSERPPAPSPGAVPLLDPTRALTAVEIRAAGTTRRFEHAGGRWSTAAGDPAPDGLAALVEALRMLPPVLVVDDAPAEPAEFGFGPDAVRLVAWSDATPALDLEVGARNPAWTGVYVRRHGERPIVMMGALLWWELAKVRGRSTTRTTLTKRHETREPSRRRPAKEVP
jgi:hypothetical protein